MRKMFFALLSSILVASSAHAGVKKLAVPLLPQQLNSWCWAAAGQMIFKYLGATELLQCQEANHELGRDDCCASGDACSSDNDCIPAGAKSCKSDDDCAAGGAKCSTDDDCPNNGFCFTGHCSTTVCRSGKCSSQMCADGCVPAVCDHGGSTEYSAWDFSGHGTTCSNPISFDDLKGEIDANRPVEFAWSFACTTKDHSGCYQLCSHWVSGGHVLAAVGYKDESGSQMVLINDPWPPKVGTKYWLTYADWIKQGSDAASDCSKSTSCDAHWSQGQTIHITDKLFCHQDVFGEDAADFQHCFDYQALRGEHAVAVSFMNDGGSQTFAASFQGVPSRPVHDRMAFTDWESQKTAQKNAGYRPDSVSVMVTGDPGAPDVTAVWVPAKSDFYSHCGLSASDLDSDSTTYTGYVMTDLFAYNTTTDPGDTVKFCATWVQQAGGYEYYYGLSENDYNTMFKTKKASLMPIRFSAYDTASSGRRYAVLWGSPASAWTQWFDMTPTFYQSQHDTLIGQGYVESNVTSLDGKYSVVWIKP